MQTAAVNTPFNANGQATKLQKYSTAEEKAL
jgi:hypothetical protein